MADGQVQAAYPTSNYGTRTTMRVRDGSSPAQSYLKFEVTGLAGTPTAIRLHLWVDDGSPDGGILYRVSDSWAEDTLDWTTAPALAGAPVGNAGSVDAGTWVDIALDPTTITADGTLSLAIGNGGSNSAYYATREHPNPPQLIIEQAGGGPPPSPTAAFSGTPTSGLDPLTVQFSDQSTGGVTTWSWDFQDDGVPDSTIRNPSFVYDAPGTYSVRLDVTGPGGSDAHVDHRHDRRGPGSGTRVGRRDPRRGRRHRGVQLVGR